MAKKRQADICADLFCGAGGMSEGLREAFADASRDMELIAINHWDVAIDSHSANHTYAKHLCANVQDADPKLLVPGGRLKFMLAGIECTHHSNARGARPRNDQSRSSAWLLLKWASELYIETIIVENVREFRSWGPLGADMKPLKSKRGETFAAFLNALESMGYNVEHRVLCAANFGDPTTRERLFVVARRGKNRNIIWPKPTHESYKQDAMFGNAARWRTAREIIEWSEKGQSIFGRKKPLAPKTIDRIAAGLRKFGGKAAEPFLVMLYGSNDVRSVDRPVPTVTASGQHIGLCEPFVLPNEGYYRGNQPRSVDDPLPTITAARGSGYLVEPFIVNMKGKSDAVSIDKPVPTETTTPHLYVCEPFVIGQQSGAQPRSVEDPIPTIATAGAISLVEPFMINIDHRGGGDSQVRAIDQPVPTVVSKQRTCLVEPFIVPQFGERDGQEPRTHSVDEPLPTVTGHGAGALVEPFLIEVNHAENGNGVRGAKSVDEPLGTITQKRAHGLIEPFVLEVNHGADLEPRGTTGRRAHSVDEPLRTVTTEPSKALVEPFVVKYYGTGISRPIDQPLDTVTSKDRFGLVTTEHGTFKLDIRFRMLTNKELARAQGLPDGYILKGKKTEITKQIGNMVPVNLAKAIIAAQM